MSKVKFNLVESCMDDCNEDDIVFVDEPYWDTTSVLNSEEEVVYNRIKEIVNGNNTLIVNVGTKGHIDHGLTQEQISFIVGRMGGCSMKGLSFASNLQTELGNLDKPWEPSVKDFMDYGEMFHNISSVEEQELRNESRGEVFKILYGYSGDLVCDSITDLIYEPETDECKGGFAKVTKGKHTYPHWYKGK